jgi:long-chain acyl-CoA synthetase
MSLPNNIQYFLDNFKILNHKAAVIWRNQRYTYSEILEKIECCQSKFIEIPEGAVVGLESDFSPETIAILFTLIYKNVIIVPLDNSQSEKNEKKIEIAQLDYLIKIDHLENVEVIQYEKIGSKNLFYDILIKSSTPGLVLFTSGSSGHPKAAFHNLSKLLLKFQTKRDPLLTINFLLFDHWGGLNTLFHILANGGTVVFLENRNPDYVCELIDKWKVELLPTSPTFLNMMLLSRAYERHNLNSLKIITYGSEPMPESVLKKMNTYFPNIKLQQTYGLIELGVMSSKSKDNESLWVKIGGNGYETRVVDGLLEIKSDSAMIGYLNAESPYTEDGWFRTGDAVEVDGEYFKILGRKSELINVGGEKVYPQEVENLILSIDHVLDVQVYGEKHPFTGNIVCAKIFFDEKCDSDVLKKEIKQTCKKMLESFKVPVKINITNEALYSNRFKKQRNN